MIQYTRYLMKLRIINKIEQAPIGKNISDKLSYLKKIAPAKLRHQEITAKITRNIITFLEN